MNNSGNRSKRQRPSYSIRLRLILLMLAITVVATASIVVVSALITQLTARNASQVSTQALTDQAGIYLVQLTDSKARENDRLLQEVRRETDEIAIYAGSILENPPATSNGSFWPADEHMTFGPDGQYINGEADISSVYVPNTKPIDGQIIQDVELTAHLDGIYPSIFKTTEDIEAVYFATPRDVVRYYPNVNLGAVLPADFRASTRPWYTGSLPQNNPGRESWWTAPYLDATGLGLVTTAAAPVYSSKGDLLGVVGLDITLRNLTASIEASRFLNSGYSFLIDGDGRTIALPAQGYVDMLGRTAGQGDVNINLLAEDTPFGEIFQQMIAGNSGFTRLEIGGRELFVAYSPLASTGWSLGSVVNAEDVLSAISGLETDLARTSQSIVLNQILPFSIVLFILVSALGLIMGNRLVQPLQKLAQAAQQLGAGEYDISLPSTQNDEIGVLAAAFESLAGKVRDMLQSLEVRVSERTADLERRTTQLQVASEIAREAATIRDQSSLLELAINLIRERFGFYHAGLFLVDDRSEYAVLQAATGEAGRKMLQNHHRLKVGEVGIVGRVTSTGEARVALDVTTDETHYRNPLLPGTRSEMALPLKIAGRVIGALDVQSEQPDAFNSDDVAIMQTLADQLAIAIENARLLQESRDSLKEMERLYASISQESWGDISKSRQTLGYQFESSKLSPVGRNEPDSDHPIEPPPLSLPLELRGQVIATLDVWPGADGLDADAMDLLKSVAERLSQTMDSARLFEEAHLRARTEQLLSDITIRVRETLDMDTVLQTAVRELRRTLDLSEAEIRLGQPPETGKNGNGNGHKS
jgi:putative methionine-R-sulfoxide reductase with GAF domain/HAMP domain-containing protein